MFGIGMPELVIILVIALLVIGPQKLPGVLRSVGKGIAELKRATNDIKRTVEKEMTDVVEETDLKDMKEAVEKDFGGVAASLNKINYTNKSPGEQISGLADVLEKTSTGSNKEKTEDVSSTPSTESSDVKKA